jgi:hypothetical protein
VDVLYPRTNSGEGQACEVGGTPIASEAECRKIASRVVKEQVEIKNFVPGF